MIKILLLLTFLFSTNLFAHSGRTNEKGCHIDRSTNTEHCHRTDNTVVEKAAEKIVESNTTSELNINPITVSKEESQEKVEQKRSTSTFFKALSTLYFFLVVILIFLFGDVLKTTIELFKVIHEKFESKTKFAIGISIFLTAITVTLVFLLVRGAF